MCNLDNRLCVSKKKWPDQVIWSFGSGSKTWEQIYSIDLNRIHSWFGKQTYALTPLAVLEKKKLLISSRGYMQKQPMVVHDPETKSYDLVFTADGIGNHVCYFESLVSIL